MALIAHLKVEMAMKGFHDAGVAGTERSAVVSRHNKDTTPPNTSGTGNAVTATSLLAGTAARLPFHPSFFLPRAAVVIGGHCVQGRR